MPRELGVEVEDQPREELLIREDPDSKPITLAAGFGVLPRGQALGRVTVSTNYAPWDAVAVDGSQVCTGMLVDEVDTSSEEPAAMYIHAVVNRDAVEWDNATGGINNNDAQIDAQILLLEARGIIVKRPDRAIDAIDIPI